MSVTHVVNLKRGEAYDVYIGRAGKGQAGTFGNPHPVDMPCPLCNGIIHKRGETIQLFREYFFDRLNRDPDFRRQVLALRGKRLGCFCAPKACHGDVIAAWIDNQPENGE